MSTSPFIRDTAPKPKIELRDVVDVSETPSQALVHVSRTVPAQTPSRRRLFPLAATLLAVTGNLSIAYAMVRVESMMWVGALCTVGVTICGIMIICAQTMTQRGEDG